jgi:hypothetical protein
MTCCDRASSTTCPGASRNKTKQNKSNQIKSNQIKSNQKFEKLTPQRIKTVPGLLAEARSTEWAEGRMSLLPFSRPPLGRFKDLPCRFEIAWLPPSAFEFLKKILNL